MGNKNIPDGCCYPLSNTPWGIHINSKITASRLTAIHFLESIILKQFKLFQCYIPVEQPKGNKKKY